jgi:group I intron endonuclease
MYTSFCSIYKVTNTLNGKIYVGQTWQTLHRRWISHCSERKNIQGECVKLARAIKKYGKSSFKMEILTVAHTQNVANFWECYFINQYHSILNGYNIREGGSRGKLSISTRNKMSQSRIGKRASEATKLKMRTARLGKKFINISKSLTGKKRSEETKNKIRVAKMGKKRGPYNKVQIM